MKTVFFTLVTLLSLSFFGSCQKEEIQPTKDPAQQIESEPCDTCAEYSIIFSIQNPDHTFNVFLNDAATSGTFEACTGDSIRLAMVQDCVANGGQCSQWEAKIERNGIPIQHITGEGSYLSYLYVVP